MIYYYDDDMLMLYDDFKNILQIPINIIYKNINK